MSFESNKKYDEIVKFAEYLYEDSIKYDKMRGFEREIGEQYYNFGIKFICNFQVDVRLCVTKRKIILQIESTEILDRDDCTFPCFSHLFSEKLSEMDLSTQEKVKKEHVKLILKGIDILNRGFKEDSKNQFFLKINNEEKVDEKEKIDYSKIFTHESIKPVYDSCGVCQENTRNLTCCGHHICIPCLIKIKRQGKKDKCPICRKTDICYFNETQNEEDRE